MKVRMIIVHEEECGDIFRDTLANSCLTTLLLQPPPTEQVHRCTLCTSGHLTHCTQRKYYTHCTLKIVYTESAHLTHCTDALLHTH